MGSQFMDARQTARYSAFTEPPHRTGEGAQLCLLGPATRTCWTRSSGAPQLPDSVQAVAFHPETGRLGLRPDSPAYGTQPRLIAARIVPDGRTRRVPRARRVALRLCCQQGLSHHTQPQGAWRSSL
ncbi:hypothetical protein [Streptomyces sp. NPDC006645]|uniref:hypothetical protein n=1 Tax=unclassified Streptomyces TaxID=2593676 RepID=UPI0033A124B7